jgi:hypothetical protein
LNLCILENDTTSNASVLGETADGSIFGVAASARFWVTHDTTPEGVQIYIAEDTTDQLEFVSPTATDCSIVMPLEEVAVAPSGFAVAVKVHHAADAATGAPLYFNDNGAADAQLVYTDGGAAGGVIPAADIEIIGPVYTADAADRLGRAAAQTFSGSALGTHTHGPGTLADAASGAGSSHTHGPGTLVDAASAAGSSHNHVFTGTSTTAAGLAEVTAAVNLSAVVVHFTAYGKF